MLRLPLLSPFIIAAVAAFAATASALILFLAANTPWLGTRLTQADEIVLMDGRPFGLEPSLVLDSLAADGLPKVDIVGRDVLAEPDSLYTFAELNAFYQRQDQLFGLLLQPEVIAKVRDQTGAAHHLTIKPSATPLWALPVSFWVQFFTGLISIIIAGWVWALRPNQLAPTLFAISGLGVLMVTLTSAYYAHRGLALPSQTYQLMLSVNHLGIFLFGGGLIGMFLIYPRQLVGLRWLYAIPVVFGALYLGDTFQLVLEAEHFYLITMLITVTILGLIVAQWWATRASPPDRAVLGWLGLSVAISVSLFCFLSIAPTVLGLNSPLSQHYAAGAIVIIYVGLALGLRRYRLFELGGWAYRILYYTFGAFLLLVLDGLLITGLNMELAPALAISLLLVGLVYLPMRDWLWHKIFTRSRIEQHELFSEAMDVAFAPTPDERSLRWRGLLQRLFDPLETEEVAEGPPSPMIEEEGQVLELPSVVGTPALKLRYPFAGTGLFQPAQQTLATQLIALTERAEESREAYMRGVSEERRRMARDLHDDVGARLLTGLHTADDRTRPVIQAALADIRSIVSGLAGDEASLERVLAEMRHETARRLEAAGIEFDCPAPDGDLPDVRLDYRIHKAMTSTVREIVSNAIRHSGATRLTVLPELSDRGLLMRFEDNGRGIPDAAMSGNGDGFGLRNLRQRIIDLGGTIHFETDKGTVITITLPLRLSARPPEPGVPSTAARLDSAL